MEASTKSRRVAELRVIPRRWLYVKSMVLAADRSQYAHNTTGLVPQFRGGLLSVSEIGFSFGRDATSVRAFDNVETRNGYSGLYRFGASYNPGKFTDPAQSQPRSGNYLLYGMADQVLWRLDPQGGKGIDATVAYDWSPAHEPRSFIYSAYSCRIKSHCSDHPLPSEKTLAKRSAIPKHSSSGSASISRPANSHATR